MIIAEIISINNPKNKRFNEIIDVEKIYRLVIFDCSNPFCSILWNKCNLCGVKILCLSDNLQKIVIKQSKKIGVPNISSEEKVYKSWDWKTKQENVDPKKILPTSPIKILAGFLFIL